MQMQRNLAAVSGAGEELKNLPKDERDKLAKHVWALVNLLQGDEEQKKRRRSPKKDSTKKKPKRADDISSTVHVDVPQMKVLPIHDQAHSNNLDEALNRANTVRIRFSLGPCALSLVFCECVSLD
jgi:hypothetical protein